MQPDSEPTSAEAHTYRAAHVGVEFDETIACCAQRLLDTPDLHYLAHYGNGLFDFAVDRLAESGASPPHDGRSLRRIGRHLTFRLQDTDEMMRRLRTGALLRMVAHYPSGFTVCMSVLPRVHLVGYSFAELRPEPVERIADTQPVDRAMVALATDLRRRIGLPSLNPGGYEDTPAGSGSGARLAESVLTGTDSATVGAACRAAVRPEDLHLVVYTVNGEIEAAADCLGDVRMRPFFTHVSVRARRGYYLELAQDFGEHAASFNLILSGALDSDFIRTVYDMELGAVFNHRVGPGRYLMGATLYQTRERDAESRLGSLAEQFRGLLG